MLRNSKLRRTSFFMDGSSAGNEFRFAIDPDPFVRVIVRMDFCAIATKSSNVPEMMRTR